VSAPVVLAFSGGLDTSYCVRWLAEQTGRPVVTVTVDTGGLDDAARARLEGRARALGAADHVLIDAREAYFERVLRFLIMGNVLRGQVYPLCVGAERSLQAQVVAAVARRLGSDAVAHGCTGAGNDQVRFEVALRALAPELTILAPVRDEAPSRAQEVSFLSARRLPVPEHGAAYSVNRGLWGVTIGGRETLESTEPIPEAAWVLTRGAFEAPRPPSRHTLAFRRGVPVAWDDQELEPVALIEAVEAEAARHGIGRGVHLGDTVLGIKGRVAFEAPAAEVLITAHRELEKLVLGSRQLRLKEGVAALYGDWVHEGHHLDPAGRDVEALLLSSQRRVSGQVSLLLRSGRVLVEGVSSPHSLMAASRALYGESTGEWSARDAAGFSRIVALPAVLAARAGGIAEHIAEDSGFHRAVDLGSAGQERPHRPEIGRSADPELDAQAAVARRREG
jgi:argininosuccinate synthase